MIGLPTEIESHISRPYSGLPFHWPLFLLSFSISRKACSANLTHTSATSAPIRQLRSVTPCRSKIAFARAHRWFQRNSFLPIPASPGLPGKLPPLASSQPPESRLVALRAAVVVKDVTLRRRGGGGGGCGLTVEDDDGRRLSTDFVEAVDMARGVSALLVVDLG